MDAKSYVFITKMYIDDDKISLLFDQTEDIGQTLTSIIREFGDTIQLVAAYPGDAKSLKDILERTKRYAQPDDTREMSCAEYNDFSQSLRLECDRKHARLPPSDPTLSIVEFWKSQVDGSLEAKPIT